jgi:hypothetical protein
VAGSIVALTITLAYLALRPPPVFQYKIGRSSKYLRVSSAFQKLKEPVNAYFAISLVNAIFFLYDPNRYFAFMGRQLAPLWYAAPDPMSIYPIRLLIILTAIIFLPGTIWATVILLLIALLAALLLLPVAMVVQQPNGSSVILALGGLSLFWIVLHKFGGNLRSILDAILLSLFTGPRLRQRRKPSPTEQARIMKKNNPIDDQDIEIQTFMKKTSRDLNMGHLPGSFEQYDGWFQEAIKRAQMREYVKTQDVRSALLGKLTAMHTELLTLRRAQGDLGRMDEENVMKGLELEERQEELRLKIARHKQAMKDLANPPKKFANRRPNPFADPDE